MCVHVFLRGETHTNAHLKMLTIIVSASLSWIKIGVVFQYLPVLKIPLEFHTDNTHIHIYIQSVRCKHTEFWFRFCPGFMYYIYSQLEIHTNYTLSDKIKMVSVMHGVSFVKYNFKI